MFLSDSKNLRIAIIAKYNDESSSAHNSHWEYNIFIENNGNSTVELIGKDLEIIYADGSIHQIFDKDFINQKYLIEPGGVLESKNYANLNTHSAIVKGHYVFISRGEEFHVDIPTFSLDNPYKSTSLN